MSMDMSMSSTQPNGEDNTEAEAAKVRHSYAHGLTRADVNSDRTEQETDTHKTSSNIPPYKSGVERGVPTDVRELCP